MSQYLIQNYIKQQYLYFSSYLNWSLYLIWHINRKFNSILHYSSLNNNRMFFTDYLLLMARKYSQLKKNIKLISVHHYCLPIPKNVSLLCYKTIQDICFYINWLKAYNQNIHLRNFYSKYRFNFVFQKNLNTIAFTKYNFHSKKVDFDSMKKFKEQMPTITTHLHSFALSLKACWLLIKLIKSKMVLSH